MKNKQYYAVLLAAVIMTASCGSGNNEKKNVSDTSEQTAEISQTTADTSVSDTSSDDAVISEVKDADATIGGFKGKYTGFVKNGRPEGEGELIVSDNVFFKGEWKNGKLCGECHYCYTYENGDAVEYGGQCIDFIPSGAGLLSREYKEKNLKIFQNGIFSEGTSGSSDCYITDYTDRMLDIGETKGEEFRSCVLDPECGGMNYCYEKSDDGSVEYVPGIYIGQINARNLPVGFGYFFAEYPTEKENRSCYSCRIGLWNNGYPYEKTTLYNTDGKAIEITESRVIQGLKHGVNINYIEEGPSVYTLIDSDGITITEKCYTPTGETVKNENGGEEPVMSFENNDVFTYRYLYSGETVYTRTKGLPDTDSYEGESYSFDKEGVLTEYREYKDGGWKTADPAGDEKEWLAAARAKVEKTASFVVPYIGTENDILKIYTDLLKKSFDETVNSELFTYPAIKESYKGLEDLYAVCE